MIVLYVHNGTVASGRGREDDRPNSSACSSKAEVNTAQAKGTEGTVSFADTVQRGSGYNTGIGMVICQMIYKRSYLKPRKL